MIAFGPVPSRRLGRSLGINNIPPKTCSYSCVYCQLGRTTGMRVKRRSFYEPEQILSAVADKAREATQSGESIDYLTFVPDGEPTLDANLGVEIALLRALGVPIAVITNSSLIWQEDVREELAQADWVSLKVDAADEDLWRQVDRPQGALRLEAILQGMLEFSRSFSGELVTETMLVEGLNDSVTSVKEIAGFLARLEPSRAYVSIPIRPPAESWVRPPKEETVNRAYQLIGARLERVEHLIGYEGSAFAFTGDVEQDLLSITAVHPMRQDAVDAFLKRAGAEWATVRNLIVQQRLVETRYGGHTFYMRKLH
jgi:wyosine [tRNA(Phe)-imidazoG37] synthetase (radical SAM superfamily)